MNGFLDDLKRTPLHQRTFFVGAGFSLATTGGASVCSWPGLLTNGVKYCLDRGLIERDEATRWVAEIKSGKLPEFAAVGDRLEQALGRANYSAWLQRAFGNLKPKTDVLLKALCNSGLSIVTTNYDTLIEQYCPKFMSYTWLDKAPWLQSIVQSNEKVLLHIHGVWNKPSSVVLGGMSYQKILDHKRVQFALRTLAVGRTLIFICFGQGLDDFNFRELFEWYSEDEVISSGRHYFLLRKQDYPSWREHFHAFKWLCPIPYGSDYSHLPKFIERNLGTAESQMTAARPIDDATVQDLNRRGNTKPVAKSSKRSLDVVKLAKISEKAETAIKNLTDTILSQRIARTFLFASNARSQNISITVSSNVLRALASIGRRESAFVCRDILGRMVVRGKDEGAWRAENGAYCHVVCTSWALFSCLKSQPTLVEDLQRSARWLVNQRPVGSDGWGFVKTCQPKAFYTALVLNALIEFARCDLATRRTVPRWLLQAIEEGIGFLWKSKHRINDYFLWKFHDDGPYFCIASTSFAIHALSKFNDLLGTTKHDLRTSISYLSEVMKEGPRDRVLRVAWDGQSGLLPYWANIRENGPTFWYKYFTPIAVMTLFRTSVSTRASFPIAIEAITNTTLWLLNNIRYVKDSGYFVNMGDDIDPRALWPSAQSILILNRWRQALSKISGDSAVLKKLVT